MGVRIALSLQDTGLLRTRLKNEQNFSLLQRVVQGTDSKGQLAYMEPASEFGYCGDGGIGHPRCDNFPYGLRVQTSDDHDL